MKNSDQQDVDLITIGVEYFLRHQYKSLVLFIYSMVYFPAQKDI